MLQVRNLPDELHAALQERARSEGMTMSDYVTKVLRRDLAKPTMAEWIAEQRRSNEPRREIDTISALDAARAEYDPDERFPRR